ncbi:MAG: helix-turn-helix transcriptional regulator [Streptosporangiaceae bacterium]
MQPRDNSVDSPARFLAELRTLRDRAGLLPMELAARAHYPIDLIQAAEVGPTLPDLPVLSAYVRGCGGEVTEWEDRWRTLSGVGATPLPDLDEGSGVNLPVRPVGGSAAAAAGAAAGASAAPPDDHDPAFIMAVLARATSAVPDVPAPTGPAPSELASVPSGYGTDSPVLASVPDSPAASVETPVFGLGAGRPSPEPAPKHAAAVSSVNGRSLPSTQSAAGVLGAIPKQARLALVAVGVLLLIIILVTALN